MEKDSTLSEPVSVSSDIIHLFYAEVSTEDI
jgi:hypothetical protein